MSGHRPTWHPEAWAGGASEMNRCVAERRRCEQGEGVEGSCTVEGSRSEGEMAMRLIQAVYPAIRCHGDIWLELPQRAASGSVVPPYLGSVVMSVAALSLKD